MTSRTFGFWYSRMITSCNRCRTPLRSPLPWPQVRCGWKWIMAWKGFTSARIMLSLHKYCAHCRSLMISYDIFFSFIVNLFFQCLHTYFSAPRLMFLLYGYLILYWQYIIYVCIYCSYHCYWKEQLLHLQINLVSHFCDALHTIYAYLPKKG